MSRRVRSRGFTLIEAVLVVLVLALTIPSGMRMVSAAERAQGESEAIYTATTLAGSIAEQVLADVHASDRFGPAALDDLATYLDDPGTGLRARVAWLLASPATQGMSFDLTVGDVGVSPAPAGLRLVTVTVQTQTMRLGTRRMPCEFLVRGGL
ncbi:MAG: type II secretory pathway pseudopilin PulG [Phycisphaerales bacterium]|jgi:type II secretory pathway pseudopilin PulG